MSNPVRVVLTYVEAAKSWDVHVYNASTPVEAAQAFNSAVLTCQELDPRLLIKTAVCEVSESIYKIVPAVQRRPRPEDN